MLPADLLAFFIEEVQHHVIDDKHTKAAELALLAHGKTIKKGPKSRLNLKTKSNKCCENCEKGGHSKAECWEKGGGKEGQGLKAKGKEKKKTKTETGNSAAITDSGDDSFAFFCTSTGPMITNDVGIPKNELEAYIDSGASQHYCLDCNKFINY